MALLTSESEAVRQLQEYSAEPHWDHSLEWPEVTYCACRVQDFEHALLPIYLHLLCNRKEGKANLIIQFN